MKTCIRTLFIALELLTLSSLNSQLSTAFAQGTTAFTYSGRLNDSGGPANGSYDLCFTLYDAMTNGDAIAALTNTATGVTNGLFSATLDFGSVFNGSNYWLELAVRTNGGAAFTALAPRQPVVPTPYALYSANAGNAVNAATAASAVTATTAGTANSVLGGQRCRHGRGSAASDSRDDPRDAGRCLCGQCNHHGWAGWENNRRRRRWRGNQCHPNVKWVWNKHIPVQPDPPFSDDDWPQCTERGEPLWRQRFVWDQLILG